MRCDLERKRSSAALLLELIGEPLPCSLSDNQGYRATSVWPLSRLCRRLV
ncbi:MAG: hypothetical protein HQL02_03735 [Nitrospirae bacterium]|nr:hypothetical protein [Nitrospirota bacterium]